MAKLTFTQILSRIPRPTDAYDQQQLVESRRFEDLIQQLRIYMRSGCDVYLHSPITIPGRVEFTGNPQDLLREVAIIGGVLYGLEEANDGELGQEHPLYKQVEGLCHIYSTCALTLKIEVALRCEYIRTENCQTVHSLIFITIPLDQFVEGS